MRSTLDRAIKENEAMDLAELSERLAKRRLEKAAPKLLESLQWAIQFAEHFARHHNDGPTMAACIAQAHAAIAEATNP